MPVYDVERWLPESLDSLLAQTGVDLEVVVVDDGSPDGSGAIADAYAARDDRVQVLHVANGGLGSARNVGHRDASPASYLGFLDSDDVLPPGALATLAGTLDGVGLGLRDRARSRGWRAAACTSRPGCGGCTASGGSASPPASTPRSWATSSRGTSCSGRRSGATRAWSGPRASATRTSRRRRAPTSRARFDVVPEVVYHWRIRHDGSSITQQRASVPDLRDRWATKRMALDAVEEYDDAGTSAYFVDRVLAGDLHRYFAEIPGASDEWWALLVGGVRELWGDRSLVHSGLPPVHRLVGWLVEHDRRADAASVVRWLLTLDGPAPREGDHLVVPRRGARRVRLWTRPRWRCGRTSADSRWFRDGPQRALLNQRTTSEQALLGQELLGDVLGLLAVDGHLTVELGEVLAWSAPPSAALRVSATSGWASRNSVETAGTRFWAGWICLSSSSRTRPWDSSVPSVVLVSPSWDSPLITDW